MDKESLIRRIYESVDSIGGYSGQERLLRECLKKSNYITRTDVRNFLKKQRSHTLHGNTPRNFLKRPVMVSGPGKILGSDLIDMGENIKKYNKNNRYILVLIDLFSRKLYVYPLKNKKKTNLWQRKWKSFFSLQQNTSMQNYGVMRD